MKRLGILLALLSAAASADQPPNIVLLIGDDHGYPYFGFMGDEHVTTPTMDALAEGGVTFTQGQVPIPYCRPSLRTMITGLYPAQYQLKLNAYVDEQLAGDADYAAMTERDRAMWMSVLKANGMSQFDTLPRMLKERGYVSWQGGKWWENSYKTAGFDEGMSSGWDMSLFGSDDFFHEMMGAEGNELVRETLQPLYDFIDRRKDEPMFIWFGPMLPHTPLDAPYTYAKFYEHKNLSVSAKKYYSNISCWDDGVSQLMDYLEAAGELDETLFIYLTDNGWEQDAKVEYWQPGFEFGSGSSEWQTGGYGGKGSMNDLGLRTPIIFYWKDGLEPRFNEHSLVSSADLVPTILDLVGLDAPDELPGRSLKPLLTGEGRYTERVQMIGYTDNQRVATHPMGKRSEGWSVRTPEWHFWYYPNEDSMRLYDVVNDPRGEHDLSAEHPELVERFKLSISAYKRDFGMPEDTLNVYE
ncbi:MAG: sulfatase-like hydrolase/transferase [Pseudomonadota bacterium]